MDNNKEGLAHEKQGISTQKKSEVLTKCSPEVNALDLGIWMSLVNEVWDDYLLGDEKVNAEERREVLVILLHHQIDFFPSLIRRSKTRAKKDQPVRILLMPF